MEQIENIEASGKNSESMIRQLRKDIEYLSDLLK